ncbi:nuclear speckle splicing regulatory protein 1 [Pieris rapae]|uniref:nuclear speckle splicing regulatory protein 1 n=1 Tax=Pieris rapae TaxID=64459 RepID=UPI001E27BA4F|nr:nuclear speckle splicing regulatory protein 1 [Pieris rapae]
MSNKKYGLIIPEKSHLPTFQASRNVFGDDSDSEDEFKKKHVLLKSSDASIRQGKIEQKKAILEDPTVYQYDEIYDSMVIQKENKAIKSKENKNPKYIENLLKTANKRKIENERRIERQIQKEREQEGEEFADKEVFVTSAYKKKLEELRLEEEKEKREEYLEKIGDVTQQQDLGGFYRHLYEQKLGFDRPQKDDINEKPEEKKQSKLYIDKFQGNKSDSSPVSKKRNYRKQRKSSHDANISEDEIADSDNEINKKKSKQTEVNIDADSDFSIDESSDDEQKPKTPSSKATVENKLIKPDDNPNIESKGGKAESTVETKLEEEIKHKLDIWKKRTVGEVFDQALKRYYERKAARGS